MKRNTIPLIFSLALIFFALASCENNNEVDLYGIEPCDTSNLSWENGIATIVNAFCVSCHNEFENYKDVRHDSYEQELNVISKSDERLRAVINHDEGYTQMPYKLPKLRDCHILMIETWLDNGVPEN